ncbi:MULTISPECIES: ABC transporter substrate-binding protein [unclassified Mesorhizobium]|uniref:ABC transporter substrate-binding protein n=1 Tax=unclassified Mesorhizobium TaxID=325217 RepID=UPI0030149B45
MTDISRRTVLLGSGTLAALLAAPRWLEAQENAPKSIRAIQPWEFKSIQPAESGFVLNRASIVEGLTALQPDGSVVPCLAASWTASDDAKEWRFVLREGVVFHDGTPVTAEAVKASMEALLPQARRLSAVHIASITAEGKEVVFHLEKPFGPLPAYLCDYAISVYAPAAFGPDGQVAQVISTGPFKVDAIELPRRLSLVRHDGYWGEKPVVERAEFEAVANGETRANMALAGDADVIMNIPTPSVSRIASSGTMQVHEVINPRVHALYPDCGKPQFSDVRTRRALSLAIDRTAIAKTIMRNADLAATQLFPPVMPDWHFDDLPRYDYDVAAAEALLDDAGWVKGPDGIRSKDGVRFAGIIRTFPNRPEMPVIAAALQAMFKTVGYELAISIGEASAIVEAKQNGTLDIGFSSRHLAIVPDGIAVISSEFVVEDSRNQSDTGATNWRNEEFDKLCDAYYGETDEKVRATSRRRLTEILQEDLPAIPIVWYSQIFAVSDRVDGFVNDPFEQRLYLDRLSFKA